MQLTSLNFNTHLLNSSTPHITPFPFFILFFKGPFILFLKFTWKIDHICVVIAREAPLNNSRKHKSGILVTLSGQESLLLGMKLSAQCPAEKAVLLKQNSCTVLIPLPIFLSGVGIKELWWRLVGDTPEGKLPAKEIGQYLGQIHIFILLFLFLTPTQTSPSSGQALGGVSRPRSCAAAVP